MIRIAFIFIFLSTTICIQSFAGKKYMPVAKQSLLLNQHKKTLKEKASGFNINDSPTSKKAPHSTKKKKRIKCIEPGCCCLPDEFSYKANMIVNQLFFSSQSSYLFRLFFSDEKRGPPSII